MLVFLAPDASKMAQLSQSVRRYLAWKSIVEEKESLNLDTYQMNQAKKSKNNLDESIQTMLPFVYEWLLVPKLEMGSKPNWIGYHLGAVDGNNPILKASRKLIAEEELLIEWSPRLLKTELDQKRLWKDQLELPIHQLWGYFTQYVYLPRLKNQEVLRQAIQKGLASKDFFGFARRKTDDTYHGFLFNQLGAQIWIDEQSLLIKPELARIILAQQDKEKAEKNKKLAEVSPVMEKPNPNPQTIPKEKPMEKPKTTLKRFNGIAKLDPERLIRDVSVISEEMIQLLQSLDQVELDIQLDMEIRVPKGIPDHLVRALKENGKQLNVQVEFYEE